MFDVIKDLFSNLSQDQHEILTKAYNSIVNEHKCPSCDIIFDKIPSVKTSSSGNCNEIKTNINTRCKHCGFQMQNIFKVVFTRS